jgi:hypothetical protein
MRAASRIEKGEKFDGLALLSPGEQELYQRIKPFFGGRKRPTLKSVASALTGGSEAKFTDKTILTHLAAVKEFGREHRDDLGYSWYFIAGVDSFGSDKTTGRELLLDVRLRMRELMRESIQRTSRLMAQAAAAEVRRAQIAEAAKFRQQFLDARKELLKQMAANRNLPAFADIRKCVLESTTGLALSAFRNHQAELRAAVLKSWDRH